MSLKWQALKNEALPASDYHFVESSQKPRIDRDKYDVAFDKAWKQIEEEYAADQIAIAKTRRKYLLAALLGFIAGAVLAIVGGVLFADDSSSVETSTTFIMLIIGCSITAVALFLGFYYYFTIPKSGVTDKTVKSFIDNFMTNYLLATTPGLTLRGVTLQNSITKNRLSRSECQTYAAAIGNTSKEMECSAIEYFFKTNDIAMMYGPGTFVRMEFSTNTRLDLEYRGKKISLLDASVVRIERREVSNGKRVSVEYYPVVCFDGMLAITEHVCNFPYALNVVAGNFGFRTPGLVKPEYELASEEFNKELKVYVGRDDGVALRKTFQPRMIAQFCDLSGYRSFRLLRHNPRHTTAIYSAGSALGLSGYNKRLFFKSKKDAFEMINRETVPFFQSFGDIIELIDCDFLQ